MSLLSRRIFFECVKVFFISILVLMTFVLMGRALQLRDILFGLELNFLDTIFIFGYLSPTFLLLMTPVSAMIAVFLTFLRMGSDREFVAVKAGGISLYQLLPAPMLFGVICSLLTFWISFSCISWGASNFRNLILDIAENRVSIALQPGTFNQDIPNMVFYARQVDTEEGTLANVIIEDSSRENAILTILSPKGNLDIDYLTGDILLLLQNGSIYTAQQDTITKLNFEEYVMRFSISNLIQDLDLGPTKPKEMHFIELQNFIGIENTNPKMLVEVHKRILFPISCFVLSFFAVAIAASCQGIHRQIGLIVALLIFFAYYSIVSFGMNIAEYNGVNPYFSIWFPVFIFFCVALYGISAAARERIPSVFEVFYRLRRIIRKQRAKRGAK